MIAQATTAEALQAQPHAGTVQIIPSGAETSAQYHRSGAWGSTAVSTFIQSPALAHELIAGRYSIPETAAMKFGTRFHALLDPGSGFATRYLQGPDVDRRTKAWTTAEAAATAAGKELIPHDDWTALHRMRESVLQNPYARSLLEGAEHEVGFRMDSPYGDFKVQCRADLWHNGSHLCDLKTTGDVAEFSKSVATYGYHRQAALYRFVASHACGGKLAPFTFIVAEKAAPLYRCRVIDLDDEYLAIGWREVEAALIEIGRRTASGDWEDHRDAEVLEPPRWLTATPSVEVG